MSFLKEIFQALEEDKSGDLSMLPSDIMSEIQYKIRRGSQDIKQKWANALELVHKAYEVVGVQRPTPEMKDAWKQYEQNIQYAIQRLAKDRGMDGDWRMSSSTFRESVTEKSKFKVIIDVANPQIVFVEADSFDEVVKNISSTLTEDIEIRIVDISENKKQLKFSSFGICRKQTVLIEKS